MGAFLKFVQKKHSYVSMDIKGIIKQLIWPQPFREIRHGGIPQVCTEKA
jgi:hypothetical protein